MVEYKNGDLLKSNCDVICHQTNCMGVMGSGIARQIRVTYPLVFTAYKRFCDEYGAESVFGHTLLCPTALDSKRYVANMFSQFDYSPRNIRHTDYDKFRECCMQLKTLIKERFGDKQIIIGFPFRIGCGLAGGDWTIVSRIIQEEFAGSEWSVEIWKC